MSKLKKVKIASVFCIFISKIRVFVLVDSYNKVCKFHVDWPVENPEESAVEDLIEQVKMFAYEQLGECSGLFPVEFSETSRDEVFKYLPSKFVSK